MRIRIDATHSPTTTTLESADDFGAFDAVVHGDVDAAEAAITAIGERTDDNHIYIDCEALKRLAGTRATEEPWQDSLGKMIDFAAGHGWVDASGRIRAHVITSGRDS